jgi:hypothetical protein
MALYFYDCHFANRFRRRILFSLGNWRSLIFTFVRQINVYGSCDFAFRGILMSMRNFLFLRYKKCFIIFTVKEIMIAYGHSKLVLFFFVFFCG